MEDKIKITFEVSRDLMRGLVAVMGMSSNAEGKKELNALIDGMGDVTLTEESAVMQDPEFAQIHMVLAAMAIAHVAKENETTKQ